MNSLWVDKQARFCCKSWLLKPCPEVAESWRVFPSAVSQLFLSSGCKAAFFFPPCNDLRFMQALFHFPEFCLDSPELKWRGRVNKSWRILLCPFHWKQFGAKTDEEVIPLPSADLSASDGTAPGTLPQMPGISHSNFPGIRLPLAFT